MKAPEATVTGSYSQMALQADATEALRALRAALVAVFVLEALNFAAAPVQGAGTWLPGLGLFTILALSVAFWVLKIPGFERHWRPATFVLCAVLVASATVMTALGREIEWQLFTLVVLSLGCGMFVPWGPGWQGLMNLACLLSLMLGAWSSSGAGVSLYAWASPLVAVAVAQAAAYLSGSWPAVLGQDDRLIRTAVDSAFDAIVTVDSEGVITGWNRGARRIFGRSRKEALGLSLLEFVEEPVLAAGPEAARRWLLAADQQAASSRVLEGEAVGVSGRFPVELTLAAVRVHGQYHFSVFIRDISARKQAEEATRHRASIAESSRDAMISLTPSGTITSWNPGAERLLGYSASEMIGRSVAFFTPNERQEELCSRLARLRQGEGSLSYETQRLRKDGSLADLWVTLSPIYDSGGAIIAASGTARDITERKRIERELSESEEKFRRIFEASADAIAINARDNETYLEVNDKFLELTGYSREELLGCTPRELNIWGNHEDLVKAATDLGHCGECHLEAEFVAKDGRRLSALFSAVRVELKGRACVLSFVRDISARKQAEETSRRLALIAESSRDAMISLTLDGTVTSWNRGAEQLFGYSESEMLGRFVAFHAPAERQEELRARLARLRRGDEGLSYETQRLLKDGSALDIWVTLSPIYDGGGALIGASATARDITERKRVERELRDSEEKFRRIFEASIDAIAINARDDGTFLDVNDKFFELTGYSREEVLGRTPRELKIWANHEDLVKAVRELGSRGECNLEAEFVAKDGQRLSGLFSAVMVELKGRDCVLSFLRDITERKRTEEASRRLASIVEFSQDALVSLTPDGIITSWNAGAERLLGYSASDVVGRSVDTFTPPDALEELHGRFVRIRQGERILRYETRRVSKDGALVDISISTSPIYGDGGTIVGISSTGRDISERKRVERELRESEEKFRRIVGASMDAITINTLSEGRYLEINEGFLKLTGYSRDEVLGKTPRELGIWARREDAVYTATELRSKGVVPNLEAEFVIKGGAVLSGLLAAVVTDFKGQPAVLSFVRDISELKRTERELVQAREAALAASRAKSQFLATMSHEIRNPLNVVIGMGELLWETPLTADQREYVRIARSTGASLLDIVSDVLDLSKVEEGHLELEQFDFDLRQLVERTVESFAARAHGKGLELVLHIALDVPCALRGDPTRLHQILDNLIGNAVKFTVRGEVVVRIQNQPTAEAAAAQVRFSVADTGIGVSAAKQQAIFTSFSQADPSISRQYGGSGLGLSICARLVALMGGSIWVESDVGKGSTFFFTARFELQPELTSAPELTRPNLEGLAILVVDDNRASRSVLREKLENQGAQVSEAATGRQAIKQVQRTRASYRILVMDGRMPEMDGFEVVERLKRSRPGIERSVIMMLAADGLREQIAATRKLGVEAYLVKPIKRPELFAALAAVVGESPTGAQPATAAADPGPVADSCALRILLAEDSEPNRLLLQAYLRNTPHTLDVVEDGQAAVTAFIAGHYDLVLMDMQMPVMDGYTAVGRIRKWELEERRPPATIFALTAHAFKEDQQNTLRAGCDAHLSKPLSKASLLAAIGKVARKPASQEAPSNHKLVVEVDTELKELVPGFVDAKRRDVDAILHALDCEDYDTVRTLGHRMKGEGGSFGMDELSEIGAALEQAAAEGATERIREGADAAASYLTRVEVVYR